MITSLETENCEPAIRGYADSPAAVTEVLDYLSVIGAGSGEIHRTRRIGTFFKVAWISPDSSMAPFINVHSAWVSVGIRAGG